MTSALRRRQLPASYHDRIFIIHRKALAQLLVTRTCFFFVP